MKSPLHEVPIDRLTDHYLMAIVTAEGKLLMEIPKDRQTPDICKQAFGSDRPPILADFPRKNKSRHACVEAVKRDVNMLRHVPRRYLDDGLQPSLSEIAIQVNP